MDILTNFHYLRTFTKIKNSIIHCQFYKIFFTLDQMKIYSITRTGKNAARKEHSSVSRSISYNNKKDPLSAQKEYIRALNATKIERLLSKPFKSIIDVFSDNIVYLVAYEDISVSVSFDGEISVRKADRHILHANIPSIKDIALDSSGLYVAVTDRIFHFELDAEIQNISSNIQFRSLSVTDGHLEITQCAQVKQPITSFFRRKKRSYILTDSSCHIFDLQFKNTAQISFKESYEKIFEKNHILFCPGHRNLDLFDERSHELIISKQIGIKTNDIAFKDNKYFITANEDAFAYLHDMRKLETPICKYLGHINAITSIDHLNNEIITGSSDKTIRIFNTFDRTSRDVYYNKRMLSISKVKIFQKKFILSGSDDGNVRLWRLNASQKENLSKREMESLEEQQILKEKYYYVGDVKRIDRHRFLPAELKGKIRHETEHHKAVLRKKKQHEDMSHNLVNK